MACPPGLDAQCCGQLMLCKKAMVERRAKEILAYLAKRMPDRKWVIESEDELLSAIAYVESLDG